MTKKELIKVVGVIFELLKNFDKYAPISLTTDICYLGGGSETAPTGLMPNLERLRKEVEKRKALRNADSCAEEQSDKNIALQRHRIYKNYNAPISSQEVVRRLREKADTLKKENELQAN